VNLDRVAAMIGKELRELRASPGTLVPVAVLLIPSVMLPLLILSLIPKISGERLSADEEIRQIVELTAQSQPALAALPIEAASQAFMLQQLLFLFLIGPIVAAVSLAAYSVVGEKQARTLEPLLTTPLTTAELLVAKVIAAFLPALAGEAVGFGLFVIVVWAFGAPGVLAAVMTMRTVVLLLIVGPLAALTALQLAIAVSSRVTDPRSAQQLSAVVVLPIAALLVGQITGAFIIGTGLLLLAAAGLFAMWVVVAVMSVAIFQRETILTRWK
jgi:ABC-2 type transport system permease protein